jgi:hypothetical protein
MRFFHRPSEEQRVAAEQEREGLIMLVTAWRCSCRNTSRPSQYSGCLLVRTYCPSTLSQEGS